jgi:histidine triad (HIT) family protein
LFLRKQSREVNIVSNCIFCKIAAGEIKSASVYEDEHVYAFKDINPQTPVHLLVIPKKHIASMNEMNAENSALVAKCLEAIPKIAKDLKLDGGYRVIANCGADAGQTVFHLHFHVLAGRPLGEKLV